MKRTKLALEIYKETCLKVIERADNKCEVMIDDEGFACSMKPKQRCSRYIPTNECRWINFLHKETRNGKSQEWVMDPNNIVYGCARHHQEEERTGIRVEYYQSKDNITYVNEI